MNAPCKNCERRFLGCHSSCEDYSAFKEQRERIIDIRAKEERVNHDFYESRKHATHRSK